MNALQWLNDLAQWVGRIFPRLTLIPPTHHGVMFGPKGGATSKGSGLVLWWPLLQLLEQVDVTVGSMDIAAVAVPGDHDGFLPRVPIVSTVARWRIVNPVLAATAANDLKRLLDNTCQSAIGQHWTGISAADGAVAAAFKDIKSELLRDFGIELLSLRRSHLGEAVAVLQLNDWTNASK